MSHPRPDLVSVAWRKRIRPEVLARDGYRCRVRLPGCKGAATQVHHLDDVAQHGPNLDLDRLVASCAYCNAALGALVVNDLRRGRRPSRAWS